MLYVQRGDDGFMCDGEWVSRTNDHPIDHHFEALEEWQERLNQEAAAPGLYTLSPDGEAGSNREAARPVSRRDIPDDKLKHGGGRPPRGGGLYRWNRRQG